MLSLKAKLFARVRFIDFISKSHVFAVFNSSFATSTCPLPVRETALRRNRGEINDSSKDFAVSSFNDRFASPREGVLSEVFRILGTSTDAKSTDWALANLGLKLDEAFVIEVFRYGNRKDVRILSCLRFFEWAGQQKGFCHTRATFDAFFRVLSRTKLMASMLDFHDRYAWCSSGAREVRFYRALVAGYAVVGKPEVSLQLFGKMRYRGMDLDSFGYNILMSSLVEHGCFEAVKSIAEQVEMRGYENEATLMAMVESLCKQKRFDEAEDYLRSKVSVAQGKALRVLVDALCRSDRFEQAGKLIDEFKEFGHFACDVWIKSLVRAGRFDEALEYSMKQNDCNGYVPNMFCSNMLVSKLLWEFRLEEARELLMEMSESKLYVDHVTMKAALCLFCKAGLVNAALNLFNSSSEFQLSSYSMSYNYLINTSCGDKAIDREHLVLQNSVERGYYPGEKAVTILTEVLINEGKLHTMKQILLFGLERNVIRSGVDYDKIISALCRGNCLEDGHLIYRKVKDINKVFAEDTFYNLITGFVNSNDGDVAARILIEMQESGYEPSRDLSFSVIRGLCQMENTEKQFIELLDSHLAHQKSQCHQIYNLFIDIAGHAQKPDLSREAYETMLRNGTKPTLQSDILMLQTYFKSGRVSDAVKFFETLREQREFGRKLCHVMLAGLCKADVADTALLFFNEMKANELLPTIQCHELLVKLLCSNGKYDTVVNIIKEYEKTGRLFTSFIGNTLLMNSFQSPELYDAWNHLSKNDLDDKSKSSMLGRLIGVFCDRIELSEERLEEQTERCFPLDLFTYNLLLRRLFSEDTDRALGLFYRMCEKGFKPNQWSYETLIHGFLRHGKREEAKRWLEEMLKNGFRPSESTAKLL